MDEQERRSILLCGGSPTAGTFRTYLLAEGYEVVQCLELESYRNLVHHSPPALVIFDDPLLEQELAAWLGPIRQTDFSGETPSLALVEPGLERPRLERWLESGVNDFVEWPNSELLVRARVKNQIRLFEALCLREKVIRDELTGVFSRRYLFESMRQHVNQYSRPGPPVLSCLMIDVDHFKRINDRLGHLEGDVVLRRVATSIYSMTRKGDIVARFGGEEFVVMLPSTDADGAEMVAEKLRAAVEQTCHDPQVTISIGVSWYRAAEPEMPGVLKDEETMELLLRRADEALYRAKNEGRNRVCLMRDSPEDERRGHQRMPLEAVVEFSLPSGVGLRKSADLSLGGVRVHDAPELQVGDRVHMSIHLAGTKLEATGTVAWTQSTRGLEDSCGITFETFGRRSRELLARHLGHASILRGEPRTRR